MAIAPPEGRPKPSVQDIFAQDSRPAPDVLRFESPPAGLGSEDIPIERYFDPAWHKLEMDRVWRKCWQMACREEELQKPGDHVVYNIGDESLLVTRTASGEIRAFVNACLHRGVLLRTHGGSLKSSNALPWLHLEHGRQIVHVLRASGLDHLDPEKFNLPEVKVGAWGGFVFVNLIRLRVAGKLSRNPARAF